jgi:ATP adenylyltransferase
MAYIRGEKKPVGGCVFCSLAADVDNAALVIARSKHVFVTLNLYPYNNGHLLVVPYEHVGSQEDMPPEALADLMLMVNRAIAALRKAYNPAAFNLGANIGAAAGAGIAEHYHFHIVPRWNGDSNFMTVVGGTRVIPDSLENSYREIKQAWTQLYEQEDHDQPS